MKALRILLFLLLSPVVNAQDRFTIESIDIYGLRSIKESEVRAQLPFSEGDAVQLDVGEISDTVAAELGVARVEIAGVCCTDSGGAVAYVGVEESSGQSPPYLPSPVGDTRLPAEVVETSVALDEAIFAAVRRGEAGEDRSQGHSLIEAPDARVLQMKFVGFADVYWEALLEVLHQSRDASQRAIAAQVIAYASDKSAVVPHLVRAALDADDGVRNNATRALGVIATYANENPSLHIEIPPEPFIDMLWSVSQTDRNKASFLLMVLTESHDPLLMSRLRARALFPLIEICNWSWDGHSLPACLILERALGLPGAGPPYSEEDKRRLTEAAMPFLSVDLRAAADRFIAD